MSIFEQSPQLTPLKNWLKESCALACSTFKLQPLANDASFRQYFRLQQDDMSRIVMIAPPDKENIIAFVTIARNLRVKEFIRQKYLPIILNKALCC